jgi:ornithine cyclodeaminase
MRAVLPIERVRVWSRTPGKAAALDGVEVVESAEEALDGADVVVTATTAREPVVRREWLAEGAHVNAVGSSVRSARELDGATIAAASLWVDRRESTVYESGDYLLALAEGAIGEDHIRGELGDLLTGAAEGRRSDDELTVFKSLGIGAEDLAAIEHVLGRAEAEGAGAEVEF